MSQTTIKFEDDVEIELNYTYYPGDNYTPSIYNPQPADEEELTIDSAMVNGVDVWYSLTSRQKEECLDACWAYQINMMEESDD
jgi:hypothetical protein